MAFAIRSWHTQAWPRPTLLRVHVDIPAAQTQSVVQLEQLHDACLTEHIKIQPGFTEIHQSIVVLQADSGMHEADGLDK